LPLIRADAGETNRSASDIWIGRATMNGHQAGAVPRNGRFENAGENVPSLLKNVDDSRQEPDRQSKISWRKLGVRFWSLVYFVWR